MSDGVRYTLSVMCTSLVLTPTDHNTRQSTYGTLFTFPVLWSGNGTAVNALVSELDRIRFRLGLVAGGTTRPVVLELGLLGYTVYSAEPSGEHLFELPWSSNTVSMLVFVSAVYVWCDVVCVCCVCAC